MATDTVSGRADVASVMSITHNAIPLRGLRVTAAGPSVVAAQGPESRKAASFGTMVLERMFDLIW